MAILDLDPDDGDARTRSVATGVVTKKAWHVGPDPVDPDQLVLTKIRILFRTCRSGTRVSWRRRGRRVGKLLLERVPRDSSHGFRATRIHSAT